LATAHGQLITATRKWPGNKGCTMNRKKEKMERPGLEKGTAPLREKKEKVIGDSRLGKDLGRMFPRTSKNVGKTTSLRRNARLVLGNLF